MKERGIIFSAPMVRAILAGRKTQTRRLVTLATSTVLGYGSKALWARLHAWDRAWIDGPNDPIGGGSGYQYLHVPAMDDGEEVWYRVRPRLRLDDRLWVREKFCSWLTEPDGIAEACYAADEDHSTVCKPPHRWHPSIFMPRWASRITLEIVGVRVERLHDIAEEDAKAEGVELPEPWGPSWKVLMNDGRCYDVGVPPEVGNQDSTGAEVVAVVRNKPAKPPTYRDRFRLGWDTQTQGELAHGPRLPLMVIEFKRIDKGGDRDEVAPHQ